MNKYDIAAYIWPAYTGDEPRTRMFWPEGMGEWQTVKNSFKKYPEHNWPRKPLWGYVNEADPRVMEMEIAAAADHGVNVFIYDWYWYDGRPFLENCLNDGYLKARNNDRVKFYLMWANHDVNHTWDVRLANSRDNDIIWRGGVDRRNFDLIAQRVIDCYFHHPSYYKIDNKPVFMIYDQQALIDGLGGVDETRSAIDWFRELAIKAGFPDLHLQMTVWGERNFNLSGVDGGKKAKTSDLIKLLGFDSMSHYQYAHFTDVNRDYNIIQEDVYREWDRLKRNFPVPYYPHVSVGWDNNPRFIHEVLNNVVKNNTPENFRKALERAKQFSDEQNTRLITINSWNEWTETSYLLPDDLYGYGYLEAIRDVFL